MNMRPV